MPDMRSPTSSPPPSRTNITFARIAGRLATLRVECAKCGRAGAYSVARLVRERGKDAAISDWVVEISSDCPRRRANQLYDLCGARCPGLAELFMLEVIGEIRGDVRDARRR